MKHTVRIRMGAAAWTIEASNGPNTYPVRIDLRKLDKDARRKAIFEVVKFVRIRRDASEARCAA